MSPERVLSQVRALSCKRPDGLMTSDHLCRVLGVAPERLDAVLRELESAGAIFASPSAGRVAVVVLGDGDDRALRRSVALEGSDVSARRQNPNAN